MLSALLVLPPALHPAQAEPDAPGSALSPVNPSARREDVRLADPDDVTLAGPLGAALQRGIQRLGQPPYGTDWLLADISFKVDRIFTNYSGDVSGRFLELATLTSPPGKPSPAALPEFLKRVTRYQKPDGHFGVDLDFNAPLKRNSPAITLLWGNARMLVGLVTASRRLHDEQLLAAARRLGNFYVNTADQLCSPNREAEYHATGTAADSYQVCYFPAMEGLVMLYQETHDDRYLQQAKRMAAMFLRFDVLPDDHSHGNLSAWRSILDLYRVTGERAYLEQAIAKWNRAVDGGFVWPIGGVGEHWYVSYNGSEGCSESDWLRFNLELWRYTGQTRYLDMAGRLLANQYVADQCGNGGFGMRHFDGGSSGPVATFGTVNEWDFCCSFHGPLGLFFLKSYLATGGKGGIDVNFPLDFSASVPAGGTEWRIESTADEAFDARGQKQVRLRFSPQHRPESPVTIRLRVPAWCSAVQIDDSSSPAVVENGYIVLARDCREAGEARATLSAAPQIEARRFGAVVPEPGKISRYEDVSLVLGSHVLFERPSRGPAPSNVLAMVDDDGRIQLLRNADGSFASVNLPDAQLTPQQILAAMELNRKVSLIPWPVPTTRRSAFAYDLTVVPARLIPEAQRQRFAQRPMDFQTQHYGRELEKSLDLWPTTLPWKFTPDGILITGGDVGLIEGDAYSDYRFEFNLQLPAAGQGITGWVVRAADEANCIMFQLQSADSTYAAPQFKTRPNTLRPIFRRNGSWTVAEPIPLKSPLRRGETHHIATECRGARITVYLDGELIYDREHPGYPAGAPGFRVAEPLDQGLFGQVSLEKR